MATEDTEITGISNSRPCGTEALSPWFNIFVNSVSSVGDVFVIAVADLVVISVPVVADVPVA